MVSPRTPVACGLGALAFALVATGCSTRALDLGSNDGGASTGTQSASDASLGTTGYGCVDLSDDQIAAARGTTCVGGCAGSTWSGDYALATQTEVVGALSGQWLFCAPGAIGPSDAIGMEFAPGCRVYFLRRDSAGAIARGTEATYQARFDVYDPRVAFHRIDLHLSETETVPFDVEAAACPNRLRLHKAGAGVSFELASDFGDAGRPDPVK